VFMYAHIHFSSGNAVMIFRFGDNDIIAALTTNLVRANLLVILSVVDGLLDEAGQRTIMVNAVDAVNLKKSDPGEVLKAAAAEEQALIDSFWK